MTMIIIECLFLRVSDVSDESVGSLAGNSPHWFVFQPYSMTNIYWDSRGMYVGFPVGFLWDVFRISIGWWWGRRRRCRFLVFVQYLFIVFHTFRRCHCARLKLLCILVWFLLEFHFDTFCRHRPTRFELLFTVVDIWSVFHVDLCPLDSYVNSYYFCRDHMHS